MENKLPLWLYLFFAAVILKFVDVLTTAYVVLTFGTEMELNPVIRNGMESFLGVGGTLFLSWVAVCLATIYSISRIDKHKWIAPAITCGIYLPVVVNNIYQLRVLF